MRMMLATERTTRARRMQKKLIAAFRELTWIPSNERIACASL
jgi:hypothetical protein